MTFIFDVPLVPLSQNAIYKRGRGRRLYMTEEGKKFKETIHALARMRAAVFPDFPTDKAVGVKLILRRGDRRGDLDGPIKPILDALQGAVYYNDKQVDELIVRRHLRHPQPGMTIEVRIL